MKSATLVLNCNQQSTMRRNWQLGVHSFWQTEMHSLGKYTRVIFHVQKMIFYFSFDNFFL